jgi:serine/threonine-protein kinase
MVMVYVPSGEFEMGSDEGHVESAFELCAHYWGDCDRERFYDELPQHTVALDSYWIDRTEVSNDQYRGCVEAEICEEPACGAGLQFDDPDQPLVCVTWHQAQAYCEWVGGRLPTEAEWEYAARGPEGRRYPWGNSFVGAWLNYCDETCGRARSDPAWNDGQLYASPVGYYPEGASWSGALDMAGNVSEWVGDWYGRYEPDYGVNPVGPAEGHSRVIRGGSWFLTRAETRTAWRQGIGPGVWFDDVGFRCVIPVREEER